MEHFFNPQRCSIAPSFQRAPPTPKQSLPTHLGLGDVEGGCHRASQALNPNLLGHPWWTWGHVQLADLLTGVLQGGEPRGVGPSLRCEARVLVRRKARLGAEGMLPWWLSSPTEVVCGDTCNCGKCGTWRGWEREQWGWSCYVLHKRPNSTRICRWAASAATEFWLREAARVRWECVRDPKLHQYSSSGHGRNSSKGSTGCTDSNGAH